MNGELNPVASAFASIVLPGSGRAEEKESPFPLSPGARMPRRTARSRRRA